MNQYNVVVTEEAQIDLRKLSETIRLEFQAPATAVHYLRGIFAEMQKLSYSAEAFPLQRPQRLFLQYGHYVRRINYKKMAILYTVHGATVYIHRVIPAATINEL